LGLLEFLESANQAAFSSITVVDGNPFTIGERRDRWILQGWEAIQERRPNPVATLSIKPTRPSAAIAPESITPGSRSSAGGRDRAQAALFAMSWVFVSSTVFDYF